MDLSTRYLGFELPHPFMPGASPLVDDLDTVRRLEDAGAAAIVMHSLFEEQIERAAASRGAAPPFVPDPEEFALGPDEYLEQVFRIKRAVRVPVIASLNGTRRGTWIEYARLIQEAGADALELNLYSIPADPDTPGRALENELVELLAETKRAAQIPVAVKLSPFYTSLAHVAARLDAAGADGLVLFNRFYQPDIDVEDRQVIHSLHLSTPAELLVRLRWLAILSGRVRATLAVSGGVHRGIDAVKAILCGADAVQMVSALLRRGPEALREARFEMVSWMEKNEHASLRLLRGSLSVLRSADPGAFERGNYLHVLQHWRGAASHHHHRPGAS